MIDLIKNYFSISSIRTRVKNKKISLLCFFDRQTCISSKSLINRFVVVRNSSINNYSYIGPNSNLHNVHVGKFCSISSNCNIGLGTHPINQFSTSPIFFSPINGTGYTWRKDKTFDDSPRRTIIGNDVWIGMNVTILGGVNIGNGAIIGSHSLVTKDVKPYSIVGGVPAKEIRNRFEEKVIVELENLKWWDLSDEFLKNNLDSMNRPVDLEKIIQFKNNTKGDSKQNNP